MDLRGMLNDNGPAAPPPSRPPPAPAPAQQPAPPPLTPVQANPPQSFRDYSQTQPSPTSRHISQDYTPQHPLPGAYAQSPFHRPAAVSYASRPPPPPPLQQIPSNDLRPASLVTGPAPSPYKQSPAPSLNTAGSFPFPPQHSPTSPVQRHQYPPASTYHRDSYPPGITGPPPAASYLQGSHIPQTPPIGTPVTAHSYLHRPQSAQSTPTSAHSQPAQYGPPFAQGSPVAPPPSLAQPDPHQRQTSQPPTPAGGVLLSARPAQAISFGQPPSPYQQRLPAAGLYPISQTSPPQLPPPSLPAQSGAQSLYDPRSPDASRGPQPPGDRDRSVSVSPKTRVPSLPSSSGRPSSSTSEREPRPSQSHSVANMMERAATPAKRKLEDRELRPDELEKRDSRPPPFGDANGRAAFADAGGPVRRPMPVIAQKKRKIHRTIPPWAQSLKDRAPAHPNRVLYRPVPHPGPELNGKLGRQPGRPDLQQSRDASPEEKRSTATIVPGPNAPPESPNQWGPLGPWEASITNSVPQEGLSKAVADFLFQSVILHPDMNEMQSRGVKFEIEAKLGTLINKETNQRVNLPVISECVLDDNGNWLGFRSSMTETQHKAYNEFLNLLVQQTHPQNKAAHARLPRPRLPIGYLHRREVDKFYELPAPARDRLLPVCVARPIAERGHGARVRVTYDQKAADRVLAKIVKARVADLSLHFPDLPLDCRISVNLEMDWDGPVEELERLAAGRPPIPARTKDRLSYKHGCYHIDLTQVISNVAGPGNSQRQEKEHELEVEVDPTPLIEQGRRAMEGQPHQYVDVVEGLVNNLRVLARKAKEFVT